MARGYLSGKNVLLQVGIRPLKSFPLKSVPLLCTYNDYSSPASVRVRREAFLDLHLENLYFLGFQKIKPTKYALP